MQADVEPALAFNTQSDKALDALLALKVTDPKALLGGASTVLLYIARLFTGEPPALTLMGFMKRAAVGRSNTKPFLIAHMKDLLLPGPFYRRRRNRLQWKPNTPAVTRWARPTTPLLCFPCTLMKGCHDTPIADLMVKDMTAFGAPLLGGLVAGDAALQGRLQPFEVSKATKKQTRK
jgi:hypothetical protein